MINLHKDFKPKIYTDLIRVGKNGDGGYVVSKSDLENIDLILSFGLDADWSFEKEIRKITRAPIHIYDHSVSLLFFFLLAFKSIIRFIQNPIKNYYRLSGIFKIISYINFFYLKNNTHYKQMIYPSILKKDFFNNHLIDFNSIINQINFKNIFLKIDIEGFEYRILDQILKNQNKLKAIVMEFHNCDLFENRILEFIKKLNLNLVHVHVNNFSPPNQKNFATSIELSFSSISIDKKDDNLNSRTYPLAGLDYPNNLMEVDQNINFI